MAKEPPVRQSTALGAPTPVPKTAIEADGLSWGAAPPSQRDAKGGIVDAETVIGYVVAGVIGLSFLLGLVEAAIESFRGKRGVEAARGTLQELDQRVEKLSETNNADAGSATTEENLLHSDMTAAQDFLRSAKSASARRLEDAAGDRRSAVRQQSVTFVLSAVSGVAGILVLLYGAVLVYNGSVDSGVVTALAGAIPTAFAILLYRQANRAAKRLQDSTQSIYASVERTEDLFNVIQAVARIQNAEEQQRILAILSFKQIFPNATPQELATIAYPVDLARDFPHLPARQYPGAVPMFLIVTDSG
jgi:ABC-type multidrug transport system fused ATPase/permease subunit